jgi:hypothetical protein
MRISNYNKTIHDIYTFDETIPIRCISWGFGSGPIIPCVPTEYSSYVDPNTGQTVNIQPNEPFPEGFVFRNQIPPTGYNPGMRAFLESRGVPVPDFSGLHVRSRGSSLNRYNQPSKTYINGDKLYDANPFFNPLDYNNWNNEIPPFCMVSPKHFLGCVHFVGQYNYNNVWIRLFPKNGGWVWKEGEYVDAHHDTSLYRLLQPLTPEEQQQINCYEILDARTIPVGTLMWRQTPNGKYVAYKTTSTAHYEEGGNLVFPKTDLYQDSSGQFPNPQRMSVETSSAVPAYDTTPPSAVWSGDSGSPILATANGKTYLYGFSYGLASEFFINDDPTSVIFTAEWIISHLKDDGITKSLVSLGSPIPPIPTIAFSLESPKRYKTGFLQEAEVNSLPFITDNPNGNPPIISIKLSGEYTINSGEQVYISNVIISEGRRHDLPFGFSCSVYVGDRRLIQNSDFCDINLTPDPEDPTICRVEEFLESDPISRYSHLTMTLNLGRLTISIVYIMGREFISPPTDKFYLSPFCLEPHAGQVSLVVENSNISTGLLTFSPGYNYELAYAIADSPSVDFAVAVGAGDGLQPCDDPVNLPKYLRSINGIRPNDRGDIKLQAPPSDCISVDSTYEQENIKLDSHCAPCCRCTDYKKSSDYIKGMAIKYNKLIKQYNVLVSTYNNIAAKFQESLALCSTADRLNTRFRMWPQQNFKVQVQAMVENNTKQPVIMKKLKLDMDLQLYESISAVDPDTGATYTLDSGSYIALVPLEDASYLYYKNLNPVSKGFTFTVPQSGSLTFEVDLTQSGMPVPAGSDGQSPYIIPSCTGYAMITGGFIIADPLFRKIVSLNYRSGLAVKSTLRFKYTGTVQNEDPCTNPNESEHDLVPGGIERSFIVKPNKSSANPCDSIQPSTISQNSAANTFKLELPQVVYGSGLLTIVYKMLTDTGWVQIDSSSLQVTMPPTGSQNIEIGQIPTATGNWQVVVSYSIASNPSERLYTLCGGPEDSSTNAHILVAPFQVGRAFTI